MRRVGLLVVAAGLLCTACERITSMLDVPPPKPAAPPVAAEPPPPPPPPPPPANPIKAAGLDRIKFTVNGPLENSVRELVEPELAAPLTQVMARLLIWWVDVAHGLRVGDTVEVLFERVPGKEPLVHALTLDSTKNMKKYTAYLHKGSQSKFARYYDADGQEVEERIEGGPVDDYEQVTSILRDGRRHKGVDFKTPNGTPVKLPFEATLTRKNWNWRGNGNSLEFMDGAGRRIVFLHLSELPRTLQVGQRFKAGQVVAESGNTGHTTAPHLHYQLEAPGGKILDPFKIHRIYHRKLEAADLEAFQQTRAKYDGLFAFDPAKAVAPAAAAAAAPGAVPAATGTSGAAVPAAAPAADPSAAPAAPAGAVQAVPAAAPVPAGVPTPAAPAAVPAVAPAAATPPPAAPLPPPPPMEAPRKRITDPGARR